MSIRPEPLTQDAFEPYGQVIETGGHRPVLINEGSTDKFADLARLELGSGGRPALHIFRARPVQAPFLIRSLECHLQGSQAFMPLHGQPFPIVVASNRSRQAIRVFISNGRQGVNLKPGTWHHYLLALEEPAEFLVIDRHSEAPDCAEWVLDKPLAVRL